MMELLLNLAWLLLALPAGWLWRRTRLNHAQRHSGSLQCLLALACALVVLFPVISATDDLRAMRTEMEESPASKRGLRQASLDRGPLGNSSLQAQPAILLASISLRLGADHAELTFPQVLTPMVPSPVLYSGRAPPARFS